VHRHVDLRPQRHQGGEGEGEKGVGDGRHRAC
jgi:hypothetical protein